MASGPCPDFIRRTIDSTAVNILQCIFCYTCQVFLLDTSGSEIMTIQSCEAMPSCFPKWLSQFLTTKIQEILLIHDFFMTLYNIERLFDFYNSKEL